LNCRGETDSDWEWVDGQSSDATGRQGEAGAREPVWLRADDGGHLSLVWPEDFTLRFAPDAAIYTDRGTLVGRAGDRIVLGQMRPGDAAGTFDDPYFASGLVFGDCYPVQQR
jgi:hypothetical protein